ncbi:MAG: preprotein translocase subunit SecF [Actinomycetota bacterium]|nr:preprotein translocase subunit SecF [Actinomycetota bacterium]
MGLASRLYRGETEFPLIQRRKTFYVISGVFVLICLASMIFRGFNVGEEFKGGASFSWAAQGTSVAQARTAIEKLGVDQPTVQTVGSSNGATKLRVTTGPLTDKKIDEVITGISTKFKVDPNNIDSANVGASWGKQVTKKAVQGLVLFLIAVIIYISIRFEPKMAIAAIVALIHDLILTAGIYSITQFVITPSTINALHTVLGYSLYDTIVVFDKVEENTRGIEKQSTLTYAEAAELAVNQTFMRSINTSLIALLPVSGLLFVGAFLLGAGTLKDLALALFVGLASGAYSSLFLATPLLADLKEREPRFQALHQRVIDRRASGKAPMRLSAQSAYATAVAGDLPGGEAPAAVAVAARPAKAPAKRPGQKKKKGGRPSGKKRR